IAAIGSILKDPEDNRPVKGGMTDALAAALAAPAQHGTDIGENVDAQAEPDCDDVLEHTSHDATLQELLESGAIDEALHTLSRLKQL
ncbi:hypothetical protein THAOC_01847, partial [Thalassiosira oceanica]